MRSLLALAIVFASCSCVLAQDQEGKLVSRLLRPNTSLGNSAQDKKFTTTDRVGINRRARVGTFYLERKSMMKTYANTRDFGTGQFDARAFNSSGTGNSLLAARSKVSTPSYAAPAARISVALRDGDKGIPSHNFSGNRPFLEKGKSQKSFDHPNQPMTIEQVRELLNKNK